MKNKRSYEKKSIIIFGGFGKLGKYIIKNLNLDKETFNLIILDQITPKDTDFKKEFNFIQCNATNLNQINEKLSNQVKLSSELIVINLIGYDFPVQEDKKQFESPIAISQSDLRKSLELNLETSHNIVQAIMKFEKKSHFVFFSSIYASKPTNSDLYTDKNDLNPKYKPYIYGASKAALEKLANDLSTYLPLKKSRINIISLGGINLGLPEDFIKRYSEWSPQNSMVSPSSLINLLHWLIIESPEELNGCNLKLDGGLSNL